MSRTGSLLMPPWPLCLAGLAILEKVAQKGLETASASSYLRPTTRFTLAPRASRLPGLGL